MNRNETARGVDSAIKSEEHNPLALFDNFWKGGGIRSHRNLVPRRNEYRFNVQPPSYASPDIIKNKGFRERLENGNLLVAQYFESYGRSMAGHVSLEIHAGEKRDVESGIWKLTITCLKYESDSKMHLWIEISYRRNAYFPDGYSSNYTLTIPGTAEHVICVGALDTASVPSVKP
ncbi:MAG: hypothetical protein U0936_18470 [Planctomycetaceae bacterium]